MVYTQCGNLEAKDARESRRRSAAAGLGRWNAGSNRQSALDCRDFEPTCECTRAGNLAGSFPGTSSARVRLRFALGHGAGTWRGAGRFFSTRRPLIGCYSCSTRAVTYLKRRLEARAGIEPAHKGFADLSLTTWVPRLGRAVFEFAPDRPSQPGWRRRAIWSGRRDLNSRPSPWQGDALPLSYSRLTQV